MVITSKDLCVRMFFEWSHWYTILQKLVHCTKAKSRCTKAKRYKKRKEKRKYSISNVSALQERNSNDISKKIER